jgi:hypothetical protein
LLARLRWAPSRKARAEGALDRRIEEPTSRRVPKGPPPAKTPPRGSQGSLEKGLCRSEPRQGASALEWPLERPLFSRPFCRERPLWASFSKSPGRRREGPSSQEEPPYIRWRFSFSALCILRLKEPPSLDLPRKGSSQRRERPPSRPRREEPLSGRVPLERSLFSKGRRLEVPPSLRGRRRERPLSRGAVKTCRETFFLEGPPSRCPTIERSLRRSEPLYI